MTSMHSARAQALTQWLTRHGGVITTSEAGALGISPAALRHGVEQRRLTRVYRGVYVDTGARRTDECTLRLALAAAGPGASASHLSAGWLHGLIDRAPARPHLTVDRSRRVRLTGVVIHQSSVAGERTTCRGLAVTTPGRTLLDLAGSVEVSAGRLGGAIDKALADGLTSPGELGLLAAPRRRQRHGAPRLRRALESRGHLGAPDASVLERKAGRLFRQLHRHHGIPEPQSEHPVTIRSHTAGSHTAGSHYRLDFAWPPLLLAVEVDGYVWHASSEAMAHDLARRNDLSGAGWTILVFTWHQVVHDPEGFMDRVAAAYRQAVKRACPASRAGSG